MAQTLSEGLVVPTSDGSEQISSTGVAEIRLLGTTANAALASKLGVTTLSSADSLDSLTAPGTYEVPLAQVGTAIGFPLNAPGGVRVEPTGYTGTNGPIVRQVAWGYLDNTQVQRTRLS